MSLYSSHVSANLVILNKFYSKRKPVTAQICQATIFKDLWLQQHLVAKDSTEEETPCSAYKTAQASNKEASLLTSFNLIRIIKRLLGILVSHKPRINRVMDSSTNLKLY